MSRVPIVVCEVNIAVLELSEKYASDDCNTRIFASPLAAFVIAPVTV